MMVKMIVKGDGRREWGEEVETTENGDEGIEVGEGG